MKITKAVIAVAGSGTRLLPATKSQPKEMLPIVDKPIIQYLVEEIAEAGIKDIILVTRWDKKPLEDHFDRSVELERSLEEDGKHEYLKEIKKISDLANFIYIRQKGPYGNGSPILSAASLIKNEPFIFAFGDDLVKSKVSFTKQLLDEYEKTQSPIIGVQKVPHKETHKYGIVKLKKGTREVANIIEKPKNKEIASDLAQFGRMVLTPEIVDILQKTPVGKGGELWITDAIRNFVKKGGKVIAQEIKNGTWLTTGDPLSFLETTIEYALERKDIGKEFRAFLKKKL